MNEFVDSQVNIGKSVFGPNCDIDYYNKISSGLGITKAIIMPTLTHELKTSEFIERSCIWERKGSDTIYRREIFYPSGEIIREINPENPYRFMNRYALKKIRNLNMNSQIEYFFIPKIHPILDTKEEIESLISEKEVVGLKINGLATYTSPNQIPEYIVRLTEEHHKPLLVHTDYLNPKFDDVRIPTNLRQIISKNTPKAWLDWAESIKPYKMFLAHLARMDKDSIDRVNNLENIVIGLGPDIMLQDEPMRLREPTTNILRDALMCINNKKLLFSSDFAWNVYDRTKWGDFDWGTKDRLEEEATKLNIEEKVIYGILGKNAIDFFGL